MPAYEQLLPRIGHATNTTIALTTIAVAFLLAFGRVAYHDYKTFMSYGPGGVPYNVFGWLTVTILLRPMCRETLGTGEYIGQDEKGTWLPENEFSRKGERPLVGPHAAPQRQLNQIPAKEMQEKLVVAFGALAKNNADLVKGTLSQFEKHTEALCLSDSIQHWPVEPTREISHVHGTSDHPVHAILSPLDCKKVIEGGWGQRHPLNGSKPFKLLTGLWVPNEYIYIYAPRDEEELEMVMMIVRAAVGFMTSSRDVK